MSETQYKPKPSWIRTRPASGENYKKIRSKINTLNLHTVCQEAHCPNMAECWGCGTATVMILGEVCTRGCRFCAVKSGNLEAAVDAGEPQHVADCIEELGIEYVVLTSVTRDDLPDGGAEHYARTVRAIKNIDSARMVEVLTPDFGGNEKCIRKVVDSGVDVFAHNIEVVRRMTPLVRDQRADYGVSLDVLATVKKIKPGLLTKSSIMVGVGETDEEVMLAMHDLRRVGCDMLTLGQYLQPGPTQLPVERYVEPEIFKEYEKFARSLGFAFVASGPMVRSSYRAAELYVKGVLKNNAPV